MQELMRLINRKFLKDIELLELEDNDFVKSCKYIKPYNAHYNEYQVVVINGEVQEVYIVYLKHR